MQSLYLMLLFFIVGNLAQDFIQLYCGNDDEYIRVIKIRRGGEFEGVMVRGECENGQGKRSKQQPIRYATSGEDMAKQRWYFSLRFLYLDFNPQFVE